MQFITEPKSAGWWSVKYDTGNRAEVEIVESDGELCVWTTSIITPGGRDLIIWDRVFTKGQRWSGPFDSQESARALAGVLEGLE